MSGDDLSASRILPVQLDTSKTQQSLRTQSILQVESADSLMAFAEEGAFSPTLMLRYSKTLESRRKSSSKGDESEKVERKQERVLSVARVEQAADRAHKRNGELQVRSLILLRSQIKEGDTKESILEKVIDMYTDHALADDAFEFLLDTTEGDLKEQVHLAREALNTKHTREIKAGKNIATQTREFAEKGLGTPTQLRAVYKEVTGNPRDPYALFDELSSNFSFDKMKNLIDFLLGSLGSDLKAKGPSIDRGELHRLLSETRKLQAILWVFRFFRSRMPLVLSSFEKRGLPCAFTFEGLSKEFMKAIQEKYPSADKILQMGLTLGLSEQLVAQIIIFTQMRDALRSVAPRLFRSNQHRQDLLNAFMEALENLDDALEEKEEDT
jgi:type III secretion protein W